MPTGKILTRKGARRRLAAGWVASISLALLVAAPLWWAADRSAAALRPADVGVVPGAVQSRAIQREAVQPGPPSWIPVDERLRTGPANPAAGRPDPVLAIQVIPGLLAEARPGPAPPRPVAIRIGAVGLTAPVTPVGVVASTGLMQVPADVDAVGWYRFGPVPGRPGSAILIGHVDARDQGLGAFFRLADLKPGHVVRVDFADGSTRVFDVVARRSYPKDRLPDAIFTRTGPATLAMITCGGRFDPVTRHYSDNVVVYAVPRT